MKNWLTGRLLGGIALAVALLPGCGPPPLEYNDKLAESNYKLASAAWTFQKTLRPLASGQPINDKEARRDYDRLGQTLQEIRSDLRAFGYPYTQPGDKLRVAYSKFLDFEDQLIQKDFAKMLQTAQNNKLAPEARWKAIDDLMKGVEKAEKEELDKVKEAENSYATSYRLSLPDAGGFGGGMMPTMPPGGGGAPGGMRPPGGPPGR